MSNARRSPLAVISGYPAHRATLGSLLASRTAAVPEREFIVFEGRSLSYREVALQVARAAAMYAARGVGAGDRVGVMSHNDPTTAITLFALAHLGATMVPVNPDFRVPETRYVLEHAQVCGVLCSPEALAVVREACSGMSPPPWLMQNAPTAAAPAVFADAVDAERTPPPASAATPDSVCVFIYTSGTTGFPKGVMHSQRNMVLAGEAFVQRMYLQPDDRLLCIQPMFHINALFYSLSGALAAGATLILLRRFSASGFWQTVAATRATEVNTVAAASNILMRRSRGEFVPHGLEKIYGGPFNDEVYRVFQREFHVPTMIEGYGMSEIPGALNNPFEGPHKIGSMGRVSVHPDPAITLTQMKVVDDAGLEVANGSVGQLVVRTPIIMKGYYRAPAETAAAFDNGWFLTGDLGWRDDDGYFWFVARKKDIIRKRGENISGAEVDRIVEGHPDVLQAAAIPVPDELGDDEILVAVLPRAGTAPTAEALAQWCRERLAPIKVPRYIVFVDALPCTPTHRVEKFKLRADATLKARAVDLGASRRAPWG